MGMSSSTNYQYDLTTGQDRAHKLGDEKSALASKQMEDLYGGNIQGLLSSANRIRDLQRYLRAVGGDESEIEVIPRARVASASQSTSLS